MTDELKTLKDLKTKEDWLNIVSPYSKTGGGDNLYLEENLCFVIDWIHKELKTEAMKWIKEYQKHEQDEDDKEASQWLIMWIIKFFNLTESDGFYYKDKKLADLPEFGRNEKCPKMKLEIKTDDNIVKREKN